MEQSTKLFVIYWMGIMFGVGKNFGPGNPVLNHGRLIGLMRYCHVNLT